MTARGMVHLVGAGPGDPDLLTLKARTLIDEADVVLHDSLVGEAIVDSIPESAVVVHVGKRPDDGRRWKQAEINHFMAELAGDGEDVVRLKGGDPTMFGRGGEEAVYLADRGIPFEFVPGVSSVNTAPVMAGIPLTHREHASSLTVVTGYEDPTKDESALDWSALADTVRSGGTLVILMGVTHLEDNMATLGAYGADPDTPVALVEHVARPDESVTIGTVATIARRARAADVTPPAVTIVGDVVGVRERLAGAMVDPIPRTRPEPGDLDGADSSVARSNARSALRAAFPNR